jgi:hypothetical protein
MKKFVFVNSDGNYEETAGAFEAAEFINATGGVSDAGKPIKTDANGVLSPTFIADYVASVASRFEMQDSVISRVTTPPGSPVIGDRYLVKATATGAFAGKENQIATYDGSAWTFVVPTVGMFLGVDDEPNGMYNFGGTTWAFKGWEQTTASGALEKTGYDITVKANGIKASMLDLGTGPDQISASDIGLLDSANNFPSDDVEAALANLAGRITAVDGITYLAGEPLPKGALVYISADDTVMKYSTLTANHKAIGITASSVLTGAEVVILANDKICAGVLPADSGVAGDIYYWTGSALSRTMPTGGGAYVIKCGVRKNASANDLHVEEIGRAHV